ncbi:assimilatory nitrate reductase NasA [Halorientalis regularis]|uniref:Assimilatory nitrate reductase (Ferredoxin) n=1 Tax=Halorientalis regularis TaxID=660518 RepID=A0A1G7SUW3_9EURY|nr:assimilatory nitrate reductase NasA [Halorientalis regularis]SDG26825.1 assimilatory nitrate reductase (ferredoxin) precursor [Halorientalis regularis]
MSEWVPTTCMRCAVGCGHKQLGVDEGYGVDVVRGDGQHPVNRGLACQRGIEESADPDGQWLSKPLVRKGGELVETSWPDALERVAERFDAALRRDRDAVAVLGSGQQTNEAAYALGKLARGGFGTRYYDANTTLCMASAVTAYYEAFGSDAPPTTYDDIPDAETHVVWGANPAIAHPVMFRWIRESAGEDDSRMIVVDPVETDTATTADEHVQLDPGEDLALARAVLAEIVDRGTVDREFVDEATDGFDDLVADLPDPATAAADAGVTPETVADLAAAFEDRTLIYWGMGINQSVRGTDAARALIDLCLASGNLKPGSGPFSLTGQANSMGTRVVSCKGSWPGQRPFDDPIHRSEIADEWGVPVGRLPDDVGPGPVGTMDAIDDGPVEAVYAVATNPVAGMPDATAVAEKLDDTFLVVQDSFRTETTELADVVLPAATWGESEGTVMNMERTVSRVRPASDTPPTVQQDIDIIAAIADEVVPGLLPEPPVDPSAMFDEFAALTEGTEADCSGIAYERLDHELGVRWPAPEPDAEGGYRYHESTDDGDDWQFATPEGTANFSDPPDPDPLPEPTDEDYPLTLTTAREADGYNTAVRSRSVDDLGPVTARINPETVASELADPAEFDGEPTARLETRRGAITAQVDPDPAVPEGLVWLPIHHPATNDLTVPATDPRSDEPNLKQCAVRVVADPSLATYESAERSSVDGSSGDEPRDGEGATDPEPVELTDGGEPR